MAKYIAEIVEKKRDPYLCPIKKINNYSFEDFDKSLFGDFEGLRLRGKGVDILDKNILYTFEVNDEDLKEGNQKHLQDNIDYSKNRTIGKNVKIGAEYIEDSEEYIKLKKVNEQDELTELFFVDSDIKLEIIYKYINAIPLSHKPITNTIYLTDGLTVIGPFTWEEKNDNYSYFSLTPYNSTDYMTNVYSYNEFKDYSHKIEAEIGIFNNLIFIDNIPSKSNIKQDCIQLENIIKIFFQNSSINDFTQKSIEESGFSKERKDRLYEAISKHDQNTNLREEFIREISKNKTILEDIFANDNYSQEELDNNKKREDELNQKIEQYQKEIEKYKNIAEENKIENNKLANLTEKYEELQSKMQTETINLNNDLATKNEELLQQNQKLEEEYTQNEQKLEDIKYKAKASLEKFDDMLNDRFTKLSKTAIDNTVDTQIIGKILKVASQHNSNTITDEINIHKFEENNNIYREYAQPKELLEYIYNNFKPIRKKYTQNDIANILLCLSLGFLTIFAGEPGTGKTSFVKHLAKFFGLTGNKNTNGTDIKRYVEVAVEKGWTSKKDLLGFYNPLTKDFNMNNQELFNGFLQLQKESKENIEDFPFFILLDEANLSPMEYYWADFMKICDYQNIEQCKINLYEGFDFIIPKYLRFLATINLDHTTEILSPRLIDRSWIIKLPSSDYSIEDCFINNIDVSKTYPLIKTNVLSEIINCSLNKDYEFKDSVKNKFDKIQDAFNKVNIKFSPRIIAMIRNYCIAADKLELMNTKTNELTAFDYAVAQKILPMIDGQGEIFKRLIEELENLTKDKMPKSNKIINDIKCSAENNGMEYYQFFAR